MKITTGLKKTVPYAIIGVLATLNGAGTANAIYRIVKKEIAHREKEHAKKELQEAVFRTMLTRLKKQGLVENPSRGIWRATKKALGIYSAVSEKDMVYKKFIAAHGKKRDTIIIFDVSEKKSYIRTCLRGELKLLGYELLQKSVWIGGGPLPEQFMEFLRDSDLLRVVHIFTVQRHGTIVS